MIQLKQTKPIATLPIGFYYLPVIIIALAGLFDSIYLVISHYRVHADLSYSSFCAISRSLNCDTVSSSPYAVFLNLPVAIWGAIGYGFVLFVLGLALHPRAQKKRLWPLLFWTSLAFSICSLILAWISTFRIQSYCIMCIITYLVNFSLLYYAWFINKRFGDRGLIEGLVDDIGFLWAVKKIVLPVIAGLLLFTITLMAALPEYWEMKLPTGTKEMHKGITEDGHPWIGAENPEMVIEEFTDYLCSQCRIKHFYLRRLISENPGKIRLVHRHFPMDHKYNPMVKEPYHMGAGTLALFSIYAQTEGKFWEANDLFFKMDQSVKAIGSRTIAGKLGLNPGSLVRALQNRSILYHLQKDIQKGLELGITGTPGYVINDEVYQGYIPPGLLKKILE